MNCMECIDDMELLELEHIMQYENTDDEIEEE